MSLWVLGLGRSFLKYPAGSRNDVIGTVCKIMTMGSNHKYNIQRLNREKNREWRELSKESLTRKVGIELRVHKGKAVRPLTGGRGSTLTDEFYISWKLCLYLRVHRDGWEGNRCQKQQCFSGKIKW